MPQWVQHKSKQGAKWEVQQEGPIVWHSDDRGIQLVLPKSEYVLCDPPTVVVTDPPGSDTLE